MNARTPLFLVAAMFACVSVGGAFFAGPAGRLYVISSGITALVFVAIALRMPRARDACPTCGQRHASGIAFCSVCGTDLPK